MTNLDIKRFLTEDGRLSVWPSKQADKELALAYLVTKFQFETTYHECQINKILKDWHTFGDWPLLRRELFERGYMARNRSGTEYIRLR